MSAYFNEYFDVLDRSVRSIDSEQLVSVAELILNLKGKIIIVGNGGSAAIASHAAIDFTKAAGISAVTFNESSLLTCLANDYGYENWVEKAIEFYANENDMVILISSSGDSENIVRGAHKAKLMNLPVVTLSGFSENNKLKQIGSINLWMNSSKYNVVEIVHQTWILSIIDFIIDKNNK